MPMCPWMTVLSHETRANAPFEVKHMCQSLWLLSSQRCVPGGGEGGGGLGGEGGGGGADGGKAAPSHTLISAWEQLQSFHKPLLVLSPMQSSDCLASFGSPDCQRVYAPG